MNRFMVFIMVIGLVMANFTVSQAQKVEAKGYGDDLEMALTDAVISFAGYVNVNVSSEISEDTRRSNELVLVQLGDGLVVKSGIAFEVSQEKGQLFYHEFELNYSQSKMDFVVSGRQYAYDFEAINKHVSNQELKVQQDETLIYNHSWKNAALRSQKSSNGVYLATMFQYLHAIGVEVNFSVEFAKPVVILSCDYAVLEKIGKNLDNPLIEEQRKQLQQKLKDFETKSFM